MPIQFSSLLSQRLSQRHLPKPGNRFTIIIVRRALTMLMLGVLLVQLGPACGLGNAAMDSMQCCQSKCPAHSSQTPANCCRIAASADKAKPGIGTTPQPALVYMIGHCAPV